MHARLILTATLALALAAPALADDHGDGDAMDMAMYPCESDADCEEHKMVCGDEGHCDFQWDEPDFCESDTDCGETEHCVWSACHEKGRYCMTDEDCGQYQMCDMLIGGSSVVIETAEATSEAELPQEGGSGSDSSSGAMPQMEPSTCESDADCGDGEVCMSGMCTWEEEDDFTPANSEEWGLCKIDPDQVPEDATCAAMCEAMMACEMTGQTGDRETGTTDSASSSSSDGDASAGFETPSSEEPDEGATEEVMSCESDEDCLDPGEVCIDGFCGRDTDGGGMPESGGPSPETALAWCTSMCSYAVLNEVASDELAALNQCIEDNTVADEPCAFMDPCDAASEAYGDAVNSSDIAGDFMFGAAEASGAGAEGTGGEPLDSSTAGNDDDGSESGGTGSSGGSSDSDSGGCGATDAPVIPWLVLLALGLAAVLRRRRLA